MTRQEKEKKIREQLSHDIQMPSTVDSDKVLLIKSIVDKNFNYEELERLKAVLAQLNH